MASSSHIHQPTLPANIPYTVHLYRLQAFHSMQSHLMYHIFSLGSATLHTMRLNATALFESHSERITQQIQPDLTKQFASLWLDWFDTRTFWMFTPYMHLYEHHVRHNSVQIVNAT